MLACPQCRKLYPSDASTCADDGQALIPLELLPDEKAGGLAPGTMVGEYRIDRKLGAGTFGAVYAGEQPLIGKKVAIKVLHKRFAADAGVVSRFVAEARAVNLIRHKNIIDVFSFGVLDGGKEPYFVMELLDGMTLGELLDHNKKISVEEAMPILRGIADGLDAAHEAGITHRDLKPDNIFLAAEKGGGYFPKLLDFGVAKLVDEEAAHKTATGAAVGTPSYMAPEQCRGKRVDHRADIYALGVVIHEMLTGKRLFQADSAMDVLFKHVNEPPPPMSEVSPDLPPELDAPVLAMLAKRPKDRPSSAGVAVAALAERAGLGDRDRTAGPARRELTAFERALAHRAASTVKTHGVAAAATPSEESPALRSGVELPSDDAPEHLADQAPDATHEPKGDEGPSAGDGAPPPAEGDAPPAPILPVPAMTADGRFAISSKGNTIKVWDLRTGKAVHTFQGQGPAPGSGDTPVRTPILGTTGPGVRAPRAKPRKLGSRALPALVIAVVATVLAAVAFLRRGPAPAPPLATAESPLGKVTLHLAVTPPDADVLLDGVPAGKAWAPLVVPRSDRTSALRFEKSGFEAQTVWVVPDHDADVPPVVLRAAPEAGLPR
jgi:serine/threonine-protein kinase